MGIVLCDIHGRQSLMPVCEHLDAALRAGISLQRTRLEYVEVCDSCRILCELNSFSVEGSLERKVAEDRFDALNLPTGGLCRECVAAVELSHARARMQPDPFPAYERTLTFLQREIVERLEASLLGAFPFEQSVVEPRGRALWVRYGALTRPVEITIYYVTELSRQDAILQWLERFFLNVPQRQRRVRFLEAENWQQVGRGWSRGPERLLREDEVDPP